MKSFKYLLTAVAAVIAFASCTQKDNCKPGTPVVFGVSTAGNEVPVTKAEYSGMVVEGYERINWELDDRISIYSMQPGIPEGDNRGAEYKISSTPVVDGRYSKARIAPAGNSWLIWGEGPFPAFYAIYPKITAPGSQKVHVFESHMMQSGSILEFKAMIPRSQELESEPLMYAQTTVDDKVNPVNLDFKPAVNTFDIELKNGRSTPINLRSVGLQSSSASLSGRFDITLSLGGGGNATYYLMDPNYRDVKRAYADGLTIGYLESKTVRIYTIPEDINDLTLILEETNGRISKLELRYNDEWIRFAKEGKYGLKGLEIPPVTTP